MLAGSLNEFALPDVFALLASTRKTGVLNLTGAETDGRVWIVGGQLAYAVADVTRSQLAARLLHSGEVEPADVAALVHAQAAGNGMQMSAALAGVGVQVDRATGLLYDQVVDAAFDMSRWNGGDFAFDAAPAGDVPESTPTFAAETVMSAVRSRMTEWEGIVATLPSPASVLRAVPRPPTRDGAIQILPEQWEVLTLIDGIRTVGDIIQLTGQGQFVVAKLLSALVDAALVELREAAGPLTITQQRAAHLAAIEQEVLGATEPTAGVAPQPDSFAAAQPVAAQPAAAQPVAAPAPAAADVDAHLQAAQQHAASLAEAETQPETHPEPQQEDHSDLFAPAAEPAAEESPAEPETSDERFSDEDQRSLESILNGGSPAPAAEPAADSTERTDTTAATDDEERIRELAALGLSLSSGEPVRDQQDEETPTQPESSDSADDDDLLSRLIDGVKGA